MSRAVPRRATILVASSLILSLLVLPPSNAAHNAGYFELDGDATAGGADGDDWSTLFPTDTSSTDFSSTFISEPSSNDTTYFSQSSKDIDDVSTWTATGSSAPDKDQITNAYAASYNGTPGAYLYFGADRYANNGDAALGFWFFQGNVSLSPSGVFNGSHMLNDLFIVSDFTNGGRIGNISVYRWNPAVTRNLELLGSGQDCRFVVTSDILCARENNASTASPWPYEPKANNAPSNFFPPRSFFEGGINLTAFFGGNVPCFTSFLAETRSSQQTTATLKDLAFGSFNNCPFVPPEATLSLFKVALTPVVDLGQPIGFGLVLGNLGPDAAENTFLWDDLPAVSGTWTADNSACTVTGTNLTCAFGTIELNGFRYVNVTAGTAVIGDCGPWDNFAYAVTNGGLDNATSDVVQVYVTCADVGVVKTGGDPVQLGSDVTFNITVTSYGPDPAENVLLNDTLPAISGGWTVGGANGSSCSTIGAELTCSFGTLPIGAQRNVTLTGATGDASDCGYVNNTAYVVARLDIDGTNNQSTASRYVLCSDVGIEKTPASPSVYLGAGVSFTITVTSNGPDDAENVTLTDTLPATPGSGWTITLSDPTCSIDSGVLSCAFGTIPVGASRSVTIGAGTSATTDCGIITNVAATTADVDLDSTNNEASANITVFCSDVGVAKLGGADVYRGGNVTYTITVTSAGPDAALNVTLTDTLPTDPSAWEILFSQGSCSITSGVLSCSFGDLPVGAQRNVTLTSATTPTTACGIVSNTAQVDAGVDTSSLNDNATATVTVLCADVSVLKTAADTIIDVGAVANFTITVTSNGPDPALDVTLTDTLPIVAGTWSVSAPDGGACDVTSGVLTCAFGTLPMGAQRNVTLTVTTQLADCGYLNNTAAVRAAQDSDTTNNVSTASIYVTCADVSIQKTATDPSIDVGENATFTITVTSEGPDAAETIGITDTLPTTGSVWEIVATGDGALCSITAGTLTCSFGTVPAGETRTVTVTSTTTLAACDGLENTATASARLDTNSSNDQDGATIDVTCADVSIQKTATDSAIDVGQNATYTITVTSEGPDAADTVGISDPLPATGSVWEIVATGDGALCSITAGTLTCSFGTVPSGGTRTVTVTSTVTLAACEGLENTATASARLDTNASNNQDGATIDVTCADVSILKTATDPSIDVGQNATFTITVTSEGPDAAETVGISDPLPATGSVWEIVATGDGALCSITAGTLTCSFGTVPAGGTRTVTVTSTVTLDACEGLVNTATASARVNTNSSNDQDGATIDVTCADVSIQKTATDPSIDVGENATYTITVTSEGPDAAENVSVSDPLPPTGSVWEIVATGDGALCSITSGTLTCSFGTVPAAGTRTVTVTSTVTLDACEGLENTATASARVDTNASNNQDGAAIDVTCADVSIQKTATDPGIDVGQNATYTITVTSEGPDAAENVGLTDTLPPTGSVWEIVATGDGASCSITSSVLTCAFGTVPAAGTRTVTVTSTVTLDACEGLDNTATASARVDTNSSNDQDGAGIGVGCADVSILKTAAQSTIEVGENATFTLTVTSEGPDAAENVGLNDTLPATGSAWEIVPTGDGASCSITSGVLTCAFGTVPANESRTVTVTSTTTLTACDGLVNTATAFARLDTLADNNVSTASISVTCADVGVAKTAVSGTVSLGDPVSFNITVTSFGPDAAEAVTLIDSVPNPSASWSVGGSDGGSCILSSGTLTCLFGTLGPGAQRNVTLTATTSTISDCAVWENTATVRATVDTDASNDASTANVTVLCPNLTLVKKADSANVTAGGSIGFTLWVNNSGPGVAKGVTVTDPLPGGSGVNWSLSPSVTGCSVTGAVPTQTLSCALGDLADDASVAIHLLSGTSAASCASYENVASANATNHAAVEARASSTVDCPANATRTQGFWKTHTAFTQLVFDTAAGGSIPIGTGSHVRTVDDYGKLFGAYYSSVSTKTDDQKRNQVDHARMVLLQQLLTAKLNCAAFGCNASIGSLILSADAAYAGSNRALMSSLTSQLDAYNNGGDNVALPAPWGWQGSATPDLSAAIANKVYWDDP